MKSCACVQEHRRPPATVGLIAANTGLFATRKEPETAPEPADYRERYARLFGRPIDICPACGGRLVDIALLKHASKPASFSYDSS